jgi:alpha-D-xyloside xylohydrolase
LKENGGGGEHRPWKFDEQTTDIYRSFVKMHYQLIPYFKEMAKKYMPQKKSLMRFLRRTDYAYFLGDDIFVSPVLNMTGTVNVKFPAEGEWVYLFDQSKIFGGGTSWSQTFPLEEYPVFVRKGSKVLDVLKP